MAGRRLVTLPPELLDAILSFNIQYCALQLWKCGDKILNHLLAAGGVTEIVLESINRKSQNRWPRLLTQFRKLRVLDISSPDQSLGDVERIRREVMKLSSSLKTLKLNFVDAQEVILKPYVLPERLFVHFSFPDDDIKDSNGDDSRDSHLIKAFGDRKMWKMKETFTNLEELEISYPPDTAGFPFQFGHFPESLKRLKLSLGFMWRLGPAHILPAGLETLDLEQCHLSTEYALNYLPKGLQLIAGRVTSENNDLIRHLPESITDLGWIPINFSRFSPPPNLTTLDISDDHVTPAVRFFEIIPASVTKITVRPSQICEKYDTIPATITSLEITSESINDVFFTKFPSHLTSLRSEFKIHSSNVSLLPATVTYLSFSLQDPSGAELAINTLPRGLHTFSIGELYFSTDLSTKRLPELNFPPRLRQAYSLVVRLREGDSHLEIEKFVRQLPKSVVELYIGFEGEFSYPPDDGNLKSIGRPPNRPRKPHEQFSTWPSNVVSALPPHLLLLKTLRYVQIAGYDYHRLPRTLVHYKTAAVTGTLPSLHHHFADLPPSLCSYKVLTYPDDVTHINYILPSQRAKNESVSLDPTSVPTPDPHLSEGIITYHVPEDWASALPKTLTEFQAYIPLDCTDCGQLPRGLKSLVVKSIDNLHSEHVRALPRRLTMLSAYTSKPGIDVQPGDLPPVVEHVSSGFTRLHRSLEKWFNQIRPYSLPYALAYPSNPEDPRRLQTMLNRLD